MNTLKQLTKLSAQLTDLLDDLERTLDYIDNDELYNEEYYGGLEHNFDFPLVNRRDFLKNKKSQAAA